MEARLRKRVIEVIEEVASRHNIGVTRLLSRGTKRVDFIPRQEAMYEVFIQCPHRSLPQIGADFGGYDHSTVRHNIATHAQRLGLTYEDAQVMSGRYGRYGLPSMPPVSYLASKYGPVMREAMNHA